MNKLGCLILLLTLILTACSSPQEDDLGQYIEQVKAKKARPIEPLPTFVVPKKFIYPENDTVVVHLNRKKWSLRYLIN